MMCSKLETCLGSLDSKDMASIFDGPRYPVYNIPKNLFSKQCAAALVLLAATLS
jgi:hypothetical protein